MIKILFFRRLQKLSEHCKNCVYNHLWIVILLSHITSYHLPFIDFCEGKLSFSLILMNAWPVYQILYS